MAEDSFPHIAPGTTWTIEAPKFIGAIPIRSDIEVLPEPPGDSIGAKEWAEHGNCAVYIPNQGILDGSWTLTEGGTVLIRSTKGGWFMPDLKKDAKGWYVECGERNEEVRIEWDMARSCWVSTSPV